MTTLTSTAPAPRPAPAPDLTVCDRESIHIPGSIQPHGFLLALDESTWKVRYASENVATFLSLELGAVLGRPVDDIIGANAAQLLRQAAGDPLFSQRAVFVERLRRRPQDESPLVLVAHRHAGHVIVEGEPHRADGVLRDTRYQLEAFLTQMEGAGEVQELLQLAAQETRRITGFDRVMVYRFDPDWNGLVIAEDRNEELPSYLDLRFPASDIPKQARELYRVNRLRLIARASYTPVKIVGPRADAPALDLTLATLRSVSPVHLEYMRNMGTGSSMSISLLRGGQLWGLISCHSREPRVVSFEVRSTCDLLGQVLSLQLAAREQANALKYRMDLQSLLSTLMGAMARKDHFAAGLIAESRTLLQLTGAAGVAVVANGEMELQGRTPTKPQVQALSNWLAGLEHEDVFQTDSLPTVFPDAKDYAWSASGLLAISISRVHQSYVLWFRPEVIGTVTWGGDPNKPVESIDPGTQRIHPRRSFETWIETVRGRALPWQSPEVEAARELRAAIIDIVLQNAERLAQLTEDLTRTNKELETFSYTVSHDLRAPFRHIRAYAELLKFDKGKMLDDEGREFLDHVLNGATYAGRLVDNILAFSQMGRTALQLTTVSLGDMVAHVIDDLKLDVAKRDVEWTVGPLPTVEADPSMLRTVVQNLVENAVKYTRGRSPARIEIGAVDGGTEHIVFVRDNGVGFDEKYRAKLFGMFQRLHRWEEFEGTGIGLASVRRIVGRHGGRVWAEGAVDRGATFYFALPKIPVAANTLYA
jgi:two-component system, chemotaxis family, sensor kinase Cph1